MIKAALKIFISATVAILPVALAACPADEGAQSVPNNKPGAVMATVEGIAIAPMAQLTTVAPLTTIAPLTTVAPYRVAGEESLGTQGLIPKAKITVLDGNLNPVADAAEGQTDEKGNFTLHLPTGRAFILKSEFGTVKKLTLYAFVKPSESGTVKLKLNVPGTLGAHLLLSKIGQRPGLLNEFSNEELEQIVGEISKNLTPEDVPDLTQISSILDRVGRIEARLTALETKVSDLEKKVDGLLSGSSTSTPSPTPSPSPSPTPSTTKSLGAFSLTGATLAAPRTLFGCVNTGKYVYAIGGFFGMSPIQSTVERASITDGTLGSFEAAPGLSLATPRGQHTQYVNDKFAYVMGGDGASGILSSVERAGLNSDGSLGSFAIVPGLSLTTPRRLATSAVIGNYVYVFGGVSTATSNVAPTFLSSIERAKINVDGTLGNFTSVPVTLTLSRAAATSTVIGSYVYVVGGQGSGGMYATVERAPIYADGSLGTFASVSGSRLVASRNQHSAIVVGNALFVVGGFSGGSWLRTIESAPINSDGTLGAFALTPRTLVTGREGHATVVSGDHVYVIGGSNALISNTSGIQGSIEVATFQ